MSAEHQPDAQREFTAEAADAGVVLMNLSFDPFAIDRGAASILDARASRRPNRDTSKMLAAGDGVRELMREAVPDASNSFKVTFLAGGYSYTGRTYLAERHNGLPSSIVLFLTRNEAEPVRLSEVGSRYHLTEREHEVLGGIAMGLTNKELAQRMKIAPNTVKTFIRLVMAKMGVKRRSGLVAKLLEHIEIGLLFALCVFFAGGSKAQTPSVAPTCAPPSCVNRLDDSAAAPLPGMLRFAVLNAPAGGSITFDPLLSRRTITLDGSSPNNHILIARDLAIQGPGSSLLTVSGGNATRLFFVNGCTVRIGGLTLADGLAKGGEGAPGTGGAGGGGGAAGMGGALFLNAGALVLDGVVFRANRAVGGNGGNGGASFGPGQGGGGGGFGGSGATGPQGAGLAGDLPNPVLPLTGSGGSGGDSAVAGLGGGDAGFGGGGGGGGFSLVGGERIGGSGGGNGFGGGPGGAAGFMDTEDTNRPASAGDGGAALGGAVFVKSGFLQLIDTSFIGNSASGGLSPAASRVAPAKGGALYLCAPGMCGPGSDAYGVWSGNSSFRANTADPGAGEGCPGRGDIQVCGRLASARVTHFTIAVPGSAVAGQTVSIAVTALDAGDIRVLTYDGALHFSCTDNNSILPLDARLPGGTGVFTVVLKSEGSQTITVTDSADRAVGGVSGSIEVTNPGY